MGKINKILNRFERAMSAVTYAESGEFDTAREIMARKKKVLLGLDSPDSNAIRYAVSICGRIDADLEVLCASQTGGDGPDRGLARMIRSSIGDIPFHCDIIQKSGSLQKEVLSHSRTRSDILFVVMGSADAEQEDTAQDARRSLLRKLPCPLVLVSDNRAAA